MGLESRQPQRAGTQSDGTPRPIEGDVTPRPADVPPELSALSLPHQVRKLAEIVAQNARGLAYEQDQRNEARRTGEQLAVLNATMERVEPALVAAHATATIVDGMRIDVRDMKGLVAALVENQARDDERIKNTDEKFERTLREIGAANASASANGAAILVLSQRVDGLDRAHQETRGRVATGETKVTHLDKRVAITRAQLGRGDKALIGGGFVGAGAIGHFLSDLVSWIGSHFH